MTEQHMILLIFGLVSQLLVVNNFLKISVFTICIYKAIFLVQSTPIFPVTILIYNKTKLIDSDCQKGMF